jgi:hypothetical protein
MAITVAAKLAQKLLKNKKLKKAINVTTKQTNKLKNAVKSNAEKVAASGAVTKANEVGKKAIEKAKPAIEKVKEKTRPFLKKTKDVVKDTKTKVTTAVGTGITATKKAANETTEKVKSLNKDKIIDFVGGPVNKAEAIGAGAALTGFGAAALTASMLKSSTPKESEYDIKRMNDGRFSTTFKDANRNAVFSSKQLSEKDVNDVRKNLAVLESVVLSTNPSYLEKQEFMARLNYLNDKYGITNITGKNLSILIPQV